MKKTKPANKQSESTKQTQLRTSARAKGTSRSIYFVDGDAVECLITLLSRYPRANLSSMLNQLIVPLTEKLQQTDSKKREVEVTLKFWL